MKPETNLFLRSLIGKEKQRLIAEKTRIVSGNCSQSPASLRLPPEDVDKIIQIDRDAKELNSALSELRKEVEKQAPLGENAQDYAPITIHVDTPVEAPAPRLSDDTANRIRKALGLYVDALRKASAPVDELLQLLPDDKKLIQARFDACRLIDQARQDLNEFNEAYPEEARK